MTKNSPERFQPFPSIRIPYKFVHIDQYFTIDVPYNAKIPMIIEKVKEKHEWTMKNVTNVIAYDSRTDFRIKRPLKNWNTASALHSRRGNHYSLGPVLLEVQNLSEWNSSLQSTEDDDNFLDKLPVELIENIIEKITSIYDQLKFLESFRSNVHRIGLRALKGDIGTVVSNASRLNLKNVIHVIRSTCDKKALNPLLLHAARTGDMELFEEMIRKGADNGNDAIAVAAECGHLAILERLLSIPKVGMTAAANSAIYEAAVNGHAAVVERLFQVPGVCFIDSNRNGYPKFCQIVENGDHIDVIEQLLSKPVVDFSVYYDSAFRSAAGKGHMQVMKRLLQEPGVDPTNLHSEAIHKAAKKGSLNAVEFLLQIPGVDPTAYDKGAIEIAAKHGHYDVVERLCSVPGVDIAFGNEFRVKYAAQHGLLEIMEQLIRDIPDYLTVNNNEPFRLAVEHGHFDIVERLLQIPGVDAKVQNNYAISKAVSNGFLNIVERLLLIPAVKNSNNIDFAIVTAASNGHLSMVESLLIQKMPKVYASSTLNWAICKAAANGHLSVMERLLQLPNVNAAAPNNEAICYASANGHLKVVERLLKISNVDPAAHNNYAIKHASTNGHLAIVKRLLQVPSVDAAADDNFAVKNASMKGYFAVVKCLLQVPNVDASAEDNFAIKNASKNGHFATVKCLLQVPNVDAAAEDNFAIQNASKNGHFAVAKCLLRVPNVNAAAENNFAIQNAAKFGHASIVELLVKVPEVNAAVNDNYVLRQAINSFHEFLSVIKCLIDTPGVDVTIDQNKLLRNAIECGDVAIVEKLMRISLVPDSVSLKYSFREAAERGDLPMLELILQLLTNGATASCNNALIKAAERGHLAVVERLLKVPGINPTHIDYLYNYDKCALYESLRNGHWDIFLKCVQLPRMIDELNYECALEKAISSGKPEIVDSFLKWSNLKPSAFNNFAMLFASQNGLIDIVEFLLQKPKINKNSSCIRKCIIEASKSGQLIILKYLLDRYEMVESVKLEAFIDAVIYNHISIVYLLKYQVDASANENEAIRRACPSNLHMVEQLLPLPGVDASVHDNFLLKKAISEGTLRTIRRLLLIPKVREIEVSVERSHQNDSVFDDICRLVQCSVEELETSEWVLSKC